MGGEISIKTEVEKGSVFTIKIPNKDSYEESEKSNINIEVEVDKLVVPNLKILIVEDEIINRMYLKTLLTKSGHQVVEARNGEEALNITSLEKPDFIFMDIGMPVMNGMEATKRIREIDEFISLPIIALTAHTHKEDVEKILESGLDEVLRKPYKGREIHSVISKYIGNIDTSTHFRSIEADL